MIKKEPRNDARIARHKRVRKTVVGTSKVPRLNVFKSNNGIYAQIIDDEKGITLASASSLSLKIKSNNVAAAKKVGAEIAAKAKEAKIKEVVFDRGGYQYHGAVQALAEVARDKGLKF